MKRHHGQGNLLKKDLNSGLQLQRVIVHDHHDKEQASRYSWCKSSSWELISWTGQADINGTRELISFSTITRLKEANWEWCGDIKNQSDTLPTRVHLLILSLIVPPVVDQASIRTHGPMVAILIQTTTAMYMYQDGLWTEKYFRCISVSWILWPP